MRDLEKQVSYFEVELEEEKASSERKKKENEDS